MSPSSSSRVCVYYSKENILLLFSSEEGEKVHKHIKNSFGWFGSIIWSQTHTHFLLCRPSFVGVPFVGVFFQRKRGKERREKDTFRVSILALEAYRYRQRVVPIEDALFEKRGIHASRERERERKREGEREIRPRSRRRARSSESISLLERQSRGERERDWIPFTLLFSQLSFLSLLGVVAAVKKAKKGGKRGKFGPKRARSGSA